MCCVVLVWCGVVWCGVLFFVCVHVVLCRCVGCVWLCGVVCGVGGACGVVVRVVVVVVKLGTREKAPCVDSKRLGVYVQDASVCTGAF